MDRKTKWIVGGALVVAVIAVAVISGGAGIAVATGTRDDDKPITGDALDKASAAALEHIGGGRVTETEVGDEDGYYEVEVTLDDGSQVDVHLDENFKVIGQEADDGPSDD